MAQEKQPPRQVGIQSNAGGDIIFEQSQVHIAGGDMHIHPPLTAQEKRERQNRQRMLDRVQAIWIEGVLEPSVQGAAQIALVLQHKPNVVVTPFWHVLQEFDKTGPFSSADGSIVQVYAHANGEVLILGEPGAGKTTLLLELTRDLLERARQDEAHPIPVVFSLSSWAAKRQPLTEWLASELHARYQVPLPLAMSWIETDQVLPLLDGLDEVAAPHRAACVEAINTYRQAHGFLPTVVCSRQTDYSVLSTRLLLRTAVVVQPLTPEQIESYLTSGDERLESLRQTLREDADLQALASTPLMLNVLTVAYQGTPHKEVAATGSLETKQKQIFATYVQHMLTRRSISTHYTPEQTTHWLSSLADQMKQQSQAIFYLEQMQPEWLAGNQMLRMYDWLAVRLPSLLTGMLISGAIIDILIGFTLPTLVMSILLGGLLGGLLGRGSVIQRQVTGGGRTKRVLWYRLLLWLGIGALIGLGVGLSYGLRGGLSYGLRDGLSFGLGSILLQVLLWKSNNVGSPSQISYSGRRMAWWRLIWNKKVYNGLLIWLLIWLSSSPSLGMIYGLILGLIYGLTGGILSALLLGRSTTIQPTDRLAWSPRSLVKSLFSKQNICESLMTSALIVLSAGLSFGLIIGLKLGFVVGLSLGIGVGLSYWLLLGLVRGVSSETIGDQLRMVPNQGIHYSAFNGLVFGLVSAIIVWLVARLSDGLSSGLAAGLQYGLAVGLRYGLATGVLSSLLTGLFAALFTGLLIGLFTGWLACLRHYILRLLLWRSGYIPWSYPQFLDYAAERILLRKVGGGYIFIHRLLLDYFAARETAPVFNEPTEHRQASTPAPVSPSNVPSEPMVSAVLSDFSVPTISLASPTTLSETPHLLPCGHELRTPSARFCSVCGASIKMPDTPTTAPAVSPSSTGESASFGGLQPPSLTHSSPEALLRSVGPSVPSALVSRSDTAIISPRRGLPVSRTVLLVGLVLLVIMGGAGFLIVLFHSACPDGLSLTQSCQTPHSLRVAYGVESLIEHGFTGKGQTIVDIVSFGSPTLRQDLDIFDKEFGLPPVKIQVISPLNEKEYDPNGDKPGWANSTTKDVEIFHTIAPDAGIVVLISPVAEIQGTVGMPEFRQLIQYAINHHLGNIISNGWHASEVTLNNPAGQQEIQKWDTLLQNATTRQGITFFASTGDNGATDYSDLHEKHLSPMPTIDFPADSPWVTSVGGTTLQQGGANHQEIAWDSSGGGFSAFYPVPSYQQTLPASVQSLLQNRRGVPDVSADADPSTGMAIYYNGSWEQAGAAASVSLWAALGAIANQMAGHPLGFINPGLYKVIASGAYTRAFHDITVGDNSVDNGAVKVKGYTAVPGWDPVTGLGSPNAEVLLPALVAALKQ